MTLVHVLGHVSILPRETSGFPNPSETATPGQSPEELLINDEGVTALMVLPKWEPPMAFAYAKIFLEFSHKPDQGDDDGHTALHYAVLIQKPLFVDLYAKSPMNKNTEAEDGETPLDTAIDPIKRGSNDPIPWIIIRILIKNGANVRGTLLDN